ncbi:FKBP-type peptidyl-prolyl cis-trans isomerase [Candidatus Saccharibacteria bacterium]|nr:FKBP-type peptidyl-prolyl cis-trans isomerase [Candidatus Saccharibacteria bacterium]
MDTKSLKTSWKQRLLIIIIAVIMLGSVIVGYALIIAGGNKGSATQNGKIDQAKVEQYAAEYQAIEAEFADAAKPDFDRFIGHKNLITAYNEGTANTSGIQTEDIEIGSGAEITDDDKNYLAYYVGWCADESIFDSSFNDKSNPTKFTKILDASAGMIEGWNLGVTGMHRDGIRIVTIPGELAYGESMEICGGKNKPLKFMIMAKAKEGPLADLYTRLDTAFLRLQYAQYGIDYDSLTVPAK